MAMACRPACCRWRARTPCSPTAVSVIPATMLKFDEPPVGVPGLSEQTAKQVRKMLALGHRPGGTGQTRADSGLLRGLASRVRRASRWARAMPPANTAPGSTGMAPIEKPRIIVAVMVDEPSNGTDLTVVLWPRLCSARWCSRVCALWACRLTWLCSPKLLPTPVEESL